MHILSISYAEKLSAVFKILSTFAWYCFQIVWSNILVWCKWNFEIPFQEQMEARSNSICIETIPAALWNGDASSHVRHPALKLDHHRRSQQTKVFFVKKNWKILWYLILLLPVPAWVPLWIDKCYLLFWSSTTTIRQYFIIFSQAWEAPLT